MKKEDYLKIKEAAIALEKFIEKKEEYSGEEVHKLYDLIKAIEQYSYNEYRCTIEDIQRWGRH